MIKWTYCKTDIPEYMDLVILSRIINYQKRRMWSIINEPEMNGYDDPFKATEAIGKCVATADDLSDEYRYMVMMFGIKDNRMAK